MLLSFRPTVALLLISAIAYTNAICENFPSLVTCRHSLPTLEQLQRAGVGSNVIIRDYRGNLEFNAQSSPSVEQQQEYSVNSIQILKSTIDQVQRGFFNRFSAGGLAHLTLNSVNGTFRLDRDTMDGLENVIQTLRVNDYRLKGADFVGQLRKLDKLSLVRTGLVQLPVGMERLLGQLVSLDLQGNKLTSMPWSVVSKRLMDVGFQTLRLSANEWRCDCSMLPMLNVSLRNRYKVTGLECTHPEPFKTRKWTDLSKKQICPASAEVKPNTGDDSSTDSKEGGGDQSGAQPSGTDRENQPGKNPDGSSNEDLSGANSQYTTGDGSPDELATAGSLSTEMIVVIVTVVVVVLVIILAVVAFKCNRKRHRQTTHDNTKYCQVIEYQNQKPQQQQNAPTQPGHNQPITRGAFQPQSQPMAPPPTRYSTPGVNNSYGRDMDRTERGPPAPGYYNGVKDDQL